MNSTSHAVPRTKPFDYFEPKQFPRNPEHEPPAAPVGYVEKGIEILLHAPAGIASEAAPVVGVYETGRGNLCPGRQISELA